VGFFVDNGSGGIENWRGGWPCWLRMTEGGYCARGQVMNDGMGRSRMGRVGLGFFVDNGSGGIENWRGGRSF